MISIVASENAKEALHPLALAYARKHIDCQWISSCKDIPDVNLLEALAEESKAIMVVGAPRRSPRNTLPGPLIKRKNGQSIPLSWLPEKNFETLRHFANAASKVHSRKLKIQPVAILSQRHKRYLHLACRIESLLSECREKTPAFLWTSDLLLRENMLEGLQGGMALALYVGHGRPIGWVGYYGTRKHHFEFGQGEPLGALLSLCCSTASRKRTGLSFAEAIPLQGAAAASFGAVSDTLHTDNTRWAVRIAKSLEKGVNTIGELIVAAQPPTLSAMKSYRIFGDPLAPLVGSDLSFQIAKKIKTYP